MPTSGGSAGLVGSINPSVPITISPFSSGGNPIAGYGGTFTSSPININSPGSPSSTSSGVSGVLFWLAIGVVGIVLLFRGGAL
jgi:hypothetical protein